MPKFVESFNRKTQVTGFGKLGTYFGPLAIGASTALLTSPCSTPILASVLTLLAGQGSRLNGILLMTFYSFGFLTIFSVLAFGLMKGAKIPRAGQWMNKVHAVTSWLIILTGGYFVTTGIFEI
jgi:cytochrome c-type biogenesis protein